MQCIHRDRTQSSVQREEAAPAFGTNIWQFHPAPRLEAGSVQVSCRGVTPHWQPRRRRRRLPSTHPHPPSSIWVEHQDQVGQKPGSNLPERLGCFHSSLIWSVKGHAQLTPLEAKLTQVLRPAGSRCGSSFLPCALRRGDTEARGLVAR